MSARILVVDDSRTIRVQLQKILSNAGYEVVLAEDGRHALEVITCEPDLMILDVLMPEMDGYGVCEELKQFGDKYANLPIVFLTSVKSHAMELLGSEFGAYLQKPVQHEELLATVEKQIQVSEESKSLL